MITPAFSDTNEPNEPNNSVGGSGLGNYLISGAPAGQLASYGNSLKSKEDSSYQVLSLDGEKQVRYAKEYTPLASNPLFDYPGDQLHPAFARTDAGLISAAFYNDSMDNIIWTSSIDDGVTFDGGVYWDVGGDYPSIKRWNDTRFFGTFVTDPSDYDGGATYLFEFNSTTYVLYGWDFSYGWYGMIDADIACDNSQNTWEWGICSYVISCDYPGYEYTNGPTILFANDTDPSVVYISWYYYDGCVHTDVDIDLISHVMYAVYDWLNTSSGNWELLVRLKDFAEPDPLTGYDALFEIAGTANLINPSVAVDDDNLVILAETDENGNKDIICYYTDDGDIENLQTSFVVSDVDDEIYPDVRHVVDQTFVCTFVKDGNLFASQTEDGGATWSVPIQINDNDGKVVEEYKTSDLCEKAKKVLWEESDNQDIDIFISDVYFNNPPYEPSDPSPDDGATCINVNADLSWTGGDPDPEDTVTYDVYFGNSSPPPQVVWTQPDTSYDPGTMDYSTTYYWQIVAWDEEGLSNGSPIWNFTTKSPNEPPVFSNPTPSNGSMDVSITLSELTVTIEDLEGDSFDWTIETSPDIGSSSGNGEGNGTKICNISGLEYNTTYTWYVNATDTGSGETTSENYTFTTENQPPVANFTFTAYGLKVDFNASKSYDPDGNIVNYSWDFGDGNTTWGNEQLVNHTYGKDGNYSVTLTVTDDNDATGSMTLYVNVSNAPPVADFNWTANGKKVEFKSTSQDPDGYIVNRTWDFGDGNTSYDENPVHTYAQENKQYDVTLTVMDNLGLTNSTTQTVKTEDTTDPMVEIVTPERAVYINGEKKFGRLLGMAIIIGDIMIEVNASDEGSGIAKVEFYGGLLGTKLLGNDTEAPYAFEWTRDRIRFFHIQMLKVVAYDNEGNVKDRGMIVRKFL